MKTRYYFLSLVALCCHAVTLVAQQAWNPFPQGQITYWHQDSLVPVDMYYCDSSYTDGLGRMVQLNASRYYRDLLPDQCEDTMYQQLHLNGYPDLPPHLPQPDTFVLDNGMLFFQNGQLSIPFYYNADTGFAWVQLVGLGAVDSVVWICDSIFLDTILGFEDSVKRFVAIPYLDSIALDSHEVLLSKWAGFQQFIPFSYVWDTTEVPLWQTIGFEQRNAGIFGFTSTSYDYALKPCAVGDVFIYEDMIYTQNSPNHFPEYSYRKDSIISLLLLPDSLEYVVQHFPNLTLDTIRDSKQHPRGFYRYPNHSISLFNDPIAPLSIQNYTYTLSDSNTIQFNVADGSCYDTALCEIIIFLRRNQQMGSTCSKSLRWEENLGLVIDFHFCSDPDGWFEQNTTTLIGHTRCGQHFGTTNYDSLRLLPVQKLNSDAASSLFKLYPNPAQNTLTLDFSELLTTEPIQISIYNLLGQAIQTFETAQTQYQCDIQHLAAGTYIVQIEHPTYRAQQKFIKY